MYSFFNGIASSFIAFHRFINYLFVSAAVYSPIFLSQQHITRLSLECHPAFQNPYGFHTVEWTKKPDASTALVLRSTGSYVERPLDAQQWIEFDWPEDLCANKPQCVSFSSLRGVLPKAAAKACTTGNTLWVDIAFLGTPFQDSWEFAWEDNQLTWRLRRAASFFPADFTISGRVNAIPA